MLLLGSLPANCVRAIRHAVRAAHRVCWWGFRAAHHAPAAPAAATHHAATGPACRAATLAASEPAALPSFTADVTATSAGAGAGAGGAYSLLAGLALPCAGAAALAAGTAAAAIAVSNAAALLSPLFDAALDPVLEAASPLPGAIAGAAIAVPEPSSAGLLACGICGFAWALRRVRRRTQRAGTAPCSFDAGSRTP